MSDCAHGELVRISRHSARHYGCHWRELLGAAWEARERAIKSHTPCLGPLDRHIFYRVTFALADFARRMRIFRYRESNVELPDRPARCSDLRRAEAADSARTLLATLPPPQRWAFSLRAGGLSMREVGERMRVSGERAGQLVLDARERLGLQRRAGRTVRNTARPLLLGIQRGLPFAPKRNPGTPSKERNLDRH